MGFHPLTPNPDPKRVIGSFLNSISGNAKAIAEISFHPSNNIGGGPRGQGVEPPVSTGKNLAPDTCGIKIRLG